MLSIKAQLLIFYEQFIILGRFWPPVSSGWAVLWQELVACAAACCAAVPAAECSVCSDVGRD